MADNFSDITWNAPARITPASTPNAATGTILRATIIAESWEHPGTMETLACGSFEVVGIKMDGPPTTVTIEAVSVPLNTPIREIRTKGWEDTTLNKIAQDICGNGGFTLVYELSDDPALDRVDQRQESDLKFLRDLCKEHGASVKVVGNQLIIFDEAEYEAREPVLTIRQGDNRLLSYSFTLDSTNTASSATAIYKDPKSGKLAQETFEPPNPPAVAKDLIVNARPSDLRGDLHRELSE